MQAKFYRLRDDVPFPRKAHPTDVGWDLTCPEAVKLSPGESCVVDTHLIVCPPPGWAFIIAPRSSSIKAGKRWRLTNTMGIIDPSYCGPTDTLKIAITAQGDQEDTIFEQGERIAQIFLVPVPMVEAQTFEGPPENTLDRGGLGSTGTH